MSYFIKWTFVGVTIAAGALLITNPDDESLDAYLSKRKDWDSNTHCYTTGMDIGFCRRVIVYNKDDVATHKLIGIIGTWWNFN